MLVKVSVLDIELNCSPISNRSLYLLATPHATAATVAEIWDALQPDLVKSTSDVTAALTEVVTEVLVDKY